MAATTILLIRHPETDWNRQRLYQGRTGRPYSDHGRVSVSRLAARLRARQIDAVVTSSTRHARVLAQRIAMEAGSSTEAVIDDAWCEIDHGAWEGLRHAEVVARFGPGAARRFTDPHYAGHGGETLAQAGVRVGPAWAALARGGAGVAVVVSHATPIRLVLCRCLGLPWTALWRWRLDPAGMTRIDVTGTGAVVGAVNCTADR